MTQARTQTPPSNPPKPIEPVSTSRRGVRRHQRLYSVAVRELKEEQLRDERPPKPLMPANWTFLHVPGSNVFELNRTVNIRDCGEEKISVIGLMEVKQPETTYRMDTGERTETEHLTVTAFIEKSRFPNGGLELTLTSIDSELVIDAMCVHSNPQDFAAARVLSRNAQLVRDLKYRGPFMTELDENLTDEILDYLDERGINNTFAEFLMAQAHYTEQQEYENWLELLKKFSA